MSEKVEQEMHFKRCDMNYALDLLRRGRGRRSDVKNKRKKFRTSVARKNNNDVSMQNGQRRIMDGWEEKSINE